MELLTGNVKVIKLGQDNNTNTNTNNNNNNNNNK